MVDRYDVLVSGEPGVVSNRMWSEVESFFGDEGLPGKTVKIEISGHDLYVKTSWFKGRMVRIDVTLSRGPSPADDLPRSQAMESMADSRYDLARMWIESECILATDLLSSGAVGPGHLVERWTGRRGYPSGYCPQLSFENPETGVEQPMPVSSPVDAVAKLIRARLVEWTDEMSVETEEEDDGGDEERGDDGGADPVDV